MPTAFFELIICQQLKLKLFFNNLVLVAFVFLFKEGYDLGHKAILVLIILLKLEVLILQKLKLLLIVL